MAKLKSRPQRWSDAVGRLQNVITEIQNHFGALEDAVGDLRDLKDEYEEWYDNLPENLGQSAVAEKLEAILELDLPDDVPSATFDDLLALVDEAEGIDLPAGFGRD